MRHPEVIDIIYLTGRSINFYNVGSFKIYKAGGVGVASLRYIVCVLLAGMYVYVMYV